MPSERLPGSSTIRSVLWFHFVYCHVRDTLVVLEELNHPLLRCPRCDVFVPWRELHGKHQATAMCAKRAERKSNRLREEEAQASIVVAFRAYRRPLGMVMEFKYFWRVLTASDGDWPAVVANLRKVQIRWACSSRILGWRGGRHPDLRTF